MREHLMCICVCNGVMSPAKGNVCYPTGSAAVSLFKSLCFHTRAFDSTFEAGLQVCMTGLRDWVLEGVCMKWLHIIELSCV